MRRHRLWAYTVKYICMRRLWLWAYFCAYFAFVESHYIPGLLGQQLWTQFKARPSPLQQAVDDFSSLQVLSQPISIVESKKDLV